MVWPVRDCGLVNLSRCTKIDAGENDRKPLIPLLAVCVFFILKIFIIKEMCQICFNQNQISIINSSYSLIFDNLVLCSFIANDYLP